MQLGAKEGQAGESSREPGINAIDEGSCTLMKFVQHNLISWIALLGSQQQRFRPARPYQRIPISEEPKG